MHFSKVAISLAREGGEPPDASLATLQAKSYGRGGCHVTALLPVLLPWQIQVPWKELGREEDANTCQLLGA